MNEGPEDRKSLSTSRQKSLLPYLGMKDLKTSLRPSPHVMKDRKPHPFLKWAGGKRQLLGQMERYFPRTYNKYMEPFVGGGAVFFHLLPARAILIDDNVELINCYKVVKENLAELIQLLKTHVNEESYYYKIRDVDRNPSIFAKWTPVQRASRTIFLNRCCFNGLYRVNSKGQFNVPFGKYKNPKFCDEDNLKLVHEAIKRTQIIKGSFELCLDSAEPGDFIYFDPPYQPLTQTANFTSYTKDNFGGDAQKRLLNVYKSLDARGCKVMLSNSYNEFILNLYNEFRTEILHAKRAINRDGTKRGKIKEVLILNY